MTAYADRVLATNPIAFWQLNDESGVTATDISGNGFNGTYTGGPTLKGDIGPDGEYAITTTGLSDQYVNVFSAGLAGAFSGQAGTVQAWIKVDASVWADGQTRSIVRLQADLSNYTEFYKNSGVNFITARHVSGGTSSIVNIPVASPTGWIVVTSTWDKSANEYKVYLNGVQQGATLGITNSWIGALTAGRIGLRQPPLWRWDGSLASVAVWNVALNSSVVALLSSVPEEATIVQPIPANIYDIILYDHNSVPQLYLQSWSRLEYHQRVNAPWNHQITLEFGYDAPELATLRTIQKDWIIEIYRIDPVTLVKSKVYEGLHTTIVDQVRANGGIIINLYGVGYSQLLQRRIVLPDSGAEYSTKTSAAETAIKEFVSDCMVGPADSNRIFPGVSIATDNLSGNDIVYNARYVNLFSLCETISEQGNLDFGVYGGTNVGEFVFDARDLWGTDLRVSNPVGNIPVIFSIERDNMLVPILSNNWSAEQNYVYVGGSGEGISRTIEEVYDNNSITASPWGRKEVFVEARQQGDTTALVAVGQAELQTRKAKQSLSFNIKQTDSSRWLREWKLGDLVSAVYYEYIFDKQIVEIGVTVEANGETINVEFEDLRL